MHCGLLHRRGVTADERQLLAVRLDEDEAHTRVIVEGAFRTQNSDGRWVRVRNAIGEHKFPATRDEGGRRRFLELGQIAHLGRTAERQDLARMRTLGASWPWKEAEAPAGEQPTALKADCVVDRRHAG